jgi:hypothetical protein
MSRSKFDTTRGVGAHDVPADLVGTVLRELSAISGPDAISSRVLDYFAWKDFL